MKTYIRSAYRKVGVTSRSQATRWFLLNVPLDVAHQSGAVQDLDADDSGLGG